MWMGDLRRSRVSEQGTLDRRVGIGLVAVGTMYLAPKHVPRYVSRHKTVVTFLYVAGHPVVLTMPIVVVGLYIDACVALTVVWFRKGRKVKR